MGLMMTTIAAATREVVVDVVVVKNEDAAVPLGTTKMTTMQGILVATTAPIRMTIIIIAIMI